MIRTLAVAILFMLISSPGGAEEKWEIVTGCIGGITGGGSGYIVSSQGDLFQWQSPTTVKYAKKLMSQLPRQRVVEWRSRLEQVGFKELRYSKAGNMTCSLTLRSDDDEHVVRWPIAGPYPLDEVMQVYNDIKALGETHSSRE